MDNHVYTVSTVTDYSRLGEIHRLTHGTLVEMKYLLPRAYGQLALENQEFRTRR